MMRKLLLCMFLSTAIAGSLSAQPTIAHAKYFTTSDCTAGCTFDLGFAPAAGDTLVMFLGVPDGATVINATTNSASGGGGGSTLDAFPADRASGYNGVYHSLSVSNIHSGIASVVFNLDSYSGGDGCWGYIIDVAGARTNSDSFDGIATWYNSPGSEGTWHTNAVTTTVANDLLLSFVDGQYEGSLGNSSTPTGWSTGPGEATAGTGTYYYQMVAATGNSYSVPNTSYSVTGFFATDVIAIAPQGAIALTLTSVAPNSGTQGSQASVTLAGTNFLAGATVAVSGTGVTASSVTVVSATQITATLTIAATAPTGSYNVSVTTSAGISNTVAFTVNAAPAPTLTSVAPNSGTQGSQVSVTLTGANFLAGATVAVSGTGVTASSVTVVSATQITALLTIAATAPTGSYNLSVTTSAGTSNTVAFTVNVRPDFTISVAPAAGNNGTVLVGGITAYTVTVTGVFNFSGPVGFNLAGLPAGATATFSPQSVSVPANGSASATLTISTGVSGAAGNYSFGVNGSSGSLVHSAMGSLSIQDFTLSITPSVISVLNEQTAQYQITAGGINGFNGRLASALPGSRSRLHAPTSSPLRGRFSREGCRSRSTSCLNAQSQTQTPAMYFRSAETAA